MQFKLEVGPAKSLAEFNRDAKWGTVRIAVDGLTAFERKTHGFSLALTEKYEVNIGSQTLVVEHKRPLLCAGFRPHNYRVFLDGDLIHEQRGF